jgi:hypothetical protein
MKAILFTNNIEQSNTFIIKQLQKEWNISLLNDRRRGNNYKIRNEFFSLENKDFRIIDSKVKYTDLKEDKRFIPDAIFIVSELMWENHDINMGYNVARELITHIYKSQFIQFVFFSILQRNILASILDIQNKNFVQVFPHIWLLEHEPQIRFTYYSEVHYKLIKNLAMSSHGRLQLIGHEMSSISTNIKQKETSISQAKNMLLNVIAELTLFKAWTTGNEIQKTIDAIGGITNEKEIIFVTKKVEQLIEKLSFKVTNHESENFLVKSNNKSNYRVFVFEDQANYRNFFNKTLSHFYDNVYPDTNNLYKVGSNEFIFTIEQARRIIRKHGKEFNIYFLDLLFKDASGNWLNFNGLDLFQLIRQVNPYAVIRIITSLPRGIVSKMVEVILNDSEKPGTDQVFTKKYGFDALRDNILESIEKINKECDSKIRLSTIIKPFPKEGPFNWHGIPDLMDELMFKNSEEFNLIKSKAENIFQLYNEGQLNRNTSEWNAGELPSPKMKTKSKDLKIYIKSKLVNIMAHRLIAINEAIKNDNNKIYTVEYQEHVIGGITNVETVNKGYFNKLGFSYEGRKKNYRGHNYIHENDFLTLRLESLFPHEKKFITEKLKSKSNLDENILMRDFNLELHNWFKRLFEDLVTYENWEELNLYFNPYSSQINRLEKGHAINSDKFPDITLKDCRNFLSALIDKYANPYIQQIVFKITNNAFDEKRINDIVIFNQINLILDK